MIILDGCQKIVDLPKFIESHERFIIALKPGKALTAYKTRLERVKALLQEHESANNI